MHIGEKIRKLRDEQRLSQVEVAKRAGIGQSYVSKIENQTIKVPPPQVVEELARAFNVNIVELLDGTSYAVEKITSLKEGIAYCPNTKCPGSNLDEIAAAELDARLLEEETAYLTLPPWEPYKTSLLDDEGEPNNFCPHCGTRLITGCLHCGRKIKAPLPYCSGCGEALFRPTKNSSDDNDDDVPF